MTNDSIVFVVEFAFWIVSNVYRKDSPMSSMLVEAYSQQLVANLNPMNQAIGSMISQSVQQGQVSLLTQKANTGKEIFKIGQELKGEQVMEEFYSKLLNQLVTS